MQAFNQINPAGKPVEKSSLALFIMNFCRTFIGVMHHK